MTPIVMHHGFLGTGDLRFGPLRLSYYRGIDRAIMKRGFPLLVAKVHPTASILTRASQLKQTLLRQIETQGLDRQRLVIFAHSMGGLDARYMITHLGMARYVRALVTICTPHRGSPFADWCAHNLGNRLGGFGLMKQLGVDVEAITDLTRQRCAMFNEQTPDVPGVKYYSISARPREGCIPAFAQHPHRIVQAAEGDNDSLVSVGSAAWGTHLATWPVDHWLAINHRFVPERLVGAIDVPGLWMEMVDRLISDGVLESDGASAPLRWDAGVRA